MTMFGWKDKVDIARGLMEFFRAYPAEDTESVEHWLKRTKTELSIRHLWSPIVMGTLNDRPKHFSTRYAGKVFHELFVKPSTGGRLAAGAVVGDAMRFMAAETPASGLMRWLSRS
jgi:protoporphyrinogen oxidase